MAKVGKISIDKLISTIDLTLDDYAKGVSKALEQASEEAGKGAETELRKTSPARTGEYRKSWTYGIKDYRRGRSYRSELVVYNETHYRLTHLLEKSHRIANKYGSYGMSTAQPHISVAQRNAEKEFISVFEKELQRIRI